MERRKWVPDVTKIADELIRDFGDGDNDRWKLDTLGTIKAWMDTAEVHGDEWQEDDWIALVQDLVRRAALYHTLWRNKQQIDPELTEVRLRIAEDEIRSGEEVSSLLTKDEIAALRQRLSDPELLARLDDVVEAQADESFYRYGIEVPDEDDAD